MSKWFEITITSTKVFAVEVESHEDEHAALEYAWDEHGTGCDGTAESKEIVGYEEIDRLKRHADEILDLDSP